MASGDPKWVDNIDNMSDEDKAKQARQEFQQMEEVRLPYESQWQYIGELILPQWEDIQQDRDPGDPLGKKQFDGTATSAHDIFTNGMTGQTANPATPWFKFQINDPKLRDISEVRAWRQEAEEQIFGALANSNFYRENFQTIKSAGGPGHGVLYVEENEAYGRTQFLSMIPWEVWIGRDQYGDINKCARKFKMYHENIVERWGLKNLPDEISREILNANNPHEDMELLNIVRPRKRRDTYKIDRRNKPWASFWLKESGKNELVEESGFDTFPYETLIYEDYNRGPYGWSPALQAVAAVRGINLMTETLLAAADLSVFPPLDAPAELEKEGREVIFSPRGINWYEDPERKVSPMNLGINYPVGKDQYAEFKQQIERFYNVQFFLLLSQSAADQPNRTAFEVSKLQEEKIILLSNVVSRLFRYYENIITRVYFMETKAGRMPEIPGILMERGAQLNFRFVGPLAKILERTFTVRPIIDALQLIGPFIQLDPSVLDNFDLDEGVREIAFRSDVPDSMMRSTDERDELRQQRAQQQAAIAEQAEQQARADTMKTTAEATEKLTETAQPG
jgi:hypothetical protein